MAGYPNAPAYGAHYSAQDQSHPPYVPAAYPAQYMQPVDGRMGTTMPSSYDMSNTAYGYNGHAPFSASAIASGVPPLPIYQGWNQSSAPLPIYNNHNDQQYMSYSDHNAHNSQHNSQYFAQTQPVYPQVSQTPQVYDEGEVSESDLDGSRRQVSNPSNSYTGTQYPTNDPSAYMKPTQQSTYSAPLEQNKHNHLMPSKQ